MNYDKNVLNNLLNKLLESRLKKLEKRNTEQLKDLKLAKTQYKKQGEILSKLIIIKPNKKLSQKEIPRQKTFDNLYSRSFIRKNKNKQQSNGIKFTPQRNKKFISRNALTPIKVQNSVSQYMLSERSNNNKAYYFHNNKYKNIKSRYMDATQKNNNSNKKLYLTPEPQIKRNKKMIDKKNLKINILPKKLNLSPKKENKKENEKKSRNINTIKREEDYKKRTIVSDIELEEDQINFVLEELRKEKEEFETNINNDNDDESSFNKEKNNNSSSSSSSSNSSKSSSNNKLKYEIKDKEIISKFGKYLISPDGKEIMTLICGFLDKRTKIRFLSISRKFIRQLTYYLDDLYRNVLDINKISFSNTIEDQINNIKNKYKEEELIEARHAFTLSKGSLKALDLLNSETYNNIFKKTQLQPPLNQIILIYRLFFQLIDKDELIDIENDKQFWEKTRKFILDKNEGKTGTFLKEYISEFDFTCKNIYKLKKLIYKNEDKLKPLIYENICKTTGLVVFIVKDSLEYCGVIKNDKKTMPNIVLDYLKYLKHIIEKAKNYIDMLKDF